MRPKPRTRPVFPGDDWGELRDAQMDCANDILGRVAGVISRHFQRSAIVMAAEDSPLAVALRRDKWFDARACYVAYGHLAAAWRLERGLTVERLQGMTDMSSLLDEWEKWLLAQAGQWFLDNPRLVRLFALVFANSQKQETVLFEMDLWDELKLFYPLPPPENLDFFDDPDSYSPYPKA